RRPGARAAAAPGRGCQPSAGDCLGYGAGRAEGRDPVPGGAGGGDHRGAVHRFQRDGRRSDGGQGKGARLGLAVWPSDERGVGLPAIEGLLNRAFARFSREEKGERGKETTGERTRVKISFLLSGRLLSTPAGGRRRRPQRRKTRVGAFTRVRSRWR